MKRRLAILFSCSFVVMIGYGLTLPVLPYYVERMALARGAGPREVSFQVGILTGIFALMQFFFAPLWGRLSDQWGRRPPFLMGLGGYGISMVLFGMGTNLTMLYGARVLGGIFSAAILPVAGAYVADNTSEEDRGPGMAWLGSAVGLGVVVGPALAAFLSHTELHLTFRFWHFSVDGFSVPFFAGSLISFLALGAAMLWLPESVKPAPFDQLGKRTHLKNVLMHKLPRLSIPRWLGAFLALAFLNQFGLSTFEGTFALHAKQVIQFGPSQMGWVFGMCGFIMAGAQVAVVGWLIGRYGEKPLLPPGFALMALGLLLLMTTQSMALILSHVTLLAFGVALISPSLASLVSKRAGDRSGATLGQLNSANNLGQSAGPVIGGFLFAWQIHAPYFLTALLVMGAAAYSGVAMLYRDRGVRFHEKEIGKKEVDSFPRL